MKSIVLQHIRSKRGIDLGFVLVEGAGEDNSRNKKCRNVICYLPLLRKMFSKYLVSGAVFNSKDM